MTWGVEARGYSSSSTYKIPSLSSLEERSISRWTKGTDPFQALPRPLAQLPQRSMVEKEKLWQEQYKIFCESVKSLPKKKFLNHCIKSQFFEIFDKIPDCHPNRWSYANAPFDSTRRDLTPIALALYCGCYPSVIKIHKLSGNKIYCPTTPGEPNLMNFVIVGYENTSIDFFQNTRIDHVACVAFLLKQNPSIHLLKNSKGFSPFEYAQSILKNKKELLEKQSGSKNRDIIIRISELEKIVSCFKNLTNKSAPIATLGPFHSNKPVLAPIAKSQEISRFLNPTTKSQEISRVLNPTAKSQEVSIEWRSKSNPVESNKPKLKAAPVELNKSSPGLIKMTNPKPY